MENLGLCTKKQVTQSLTHSRPAERGRRQAIQARPDHPNRVVSPSRGLPNYAAGWHLPKIDLFATSFNNKLPLLPEPLATAVGSLCVPWRIWTHTPSHQQPYLAKWWRSCRTPHARESFCLLQGGPTCLGLGSNGHVQPNPTEPAQPVDTALQSDPSQKSHNLNLHAWLVEPQQSKSRASLRQWQQELRLLKEDQPDQSMRQRGPYLQVVPR